MRIELDTGNGTLLVEKENLSLEDVITLSEVMGLNNNHRKIEPVDEFKITRPVDGVKLEPCVGTVKSDGDEIILDSRKVNEIIDSASPKDDVPKVFRPRKVDLVGSEHTEGFSIMDSSKIKNESSGSSDDVTAVIQCPECGEETRTTVKKWFSFATCEHCEQKVYITDHHGKEPIKTGNSKFFTREEREQFQAEKAESSEPTHQVIEKIEHNIKHNGIQSLEQYTKPQLIDYAEYEGINARITMLKRDIIKQIWEDKSHD